MKKGLFCQYLAEQLYYEYMPTPLIIGHRGACGYAPENTLASFRKAFDFHVPMIELDVHVCKSGELVVIHDDTVDRTTNGSGYVMEQTLAELQSYNAGNGEIIPTLEAVMDSNAEHTPTNIELKGPGTAEPVAELIQKYIAHGWHNDDFLVSSFNHRELKKFQVVSPQVRIGALFTGIPLDLAKSLAGLDTYSINLSREFIDQDIVDEAHELGKKVLVYTVNSRSDFERITALGVDGVFTNFPDRFLVQ